MRAHRVLLLVAMVGFSPNLFPQEKSSWISVDDPRPLASAAEVLEGLYGRIITYEDPQWLVPSETRDVTDVVRRDVANLSMADRNALPRVLVPRGGVLSFSIPELTQPKTVDPASVLQNIIVSNSAAGYRGRFRLIESDGRFHIVPIADRDVDPLDTLITIQQEDWNGIGILEAICEQISTATGTRVTLGTIPTNVFAHHHGLYHASGSIARGVLSSVLDSIGADYSWQLLFDPGDRIYALNIHRVLWANSTHNET